MGPISRGSLIMVPWPSSSAKAGDPVFREAEAQIRRRRVLDAPLSRGMTRAIFVIPGRCASIKTGISRFRISPLRVLSGMTKTSDSGRFHHQIGQPFGGIEPADLA